VFGILDFGQACIAVDPGIRNVGVAVLTGAGEVWKTWVIRPSMDVGETRRLKFVSDSLYRLFAIASQLGKPMVAVEDGMYGVPKSWPKGRTVAQIRVAAMMAEVRGVAMAEGWRRGWDVRRVSVMSWKAKLSKEERTMRKGAAYRDYWSAKLGYQFHSPDEVDACLLAYVAAGA
jgi:Holliday junction resolvasome RuvABC endonuclease subunit